MGKTTRIFLLSFLLFLMNTVGTVNSNSIHFPHDNQNPASSPDPATTASTTTTTTNTIDNNNNNNNNNNTDIDPSVKSTEKEADYNTAQGEACESGYPCDPDQWCSPSQKICRPCSDLEPWCNMTLTIHNKYSACEQYCYRVQVSKTKECEVQRETEGEQITLLSLSLRDAESTLENATRKAETDREDLIRELSQLKQLVQTKDRQLGESNQRLSGLQRDLEGLTEDFKRCSRLEGQEDQKIQGLITGIAITALMAAVAFGFALKYCMARKRGAKKALQHRRQPLGFGPDKQALLSVTTMTSSTNSADQGPGAGAPESKSPVPASRTNTNFNSQEDTYCIAGAGGRADVIRVPGDSTVSP